MIEWRLQTGLRKRELSQQRSAQDQRARSFTPQVENLLGAMA